MLRGFAVRMISNSGQPYGGRAYRDCIAEAHAHHVPIVVAARGMRWQSNDGTVLDVLAPSPPMLAETGDDVSENSIVVMLHDGAYRALFMGDAGEASKARLLAAGDDLHADVGLRSFIICGISKLISRRKLAGLRRAAAQGAFGPSAGAIERRRVESQVDEDGEREIPGTALQEVVDLYKHVLKLA